MSDSPQSPARRLAQILLLTTLLELVMYRLASQALRPSGSFEPALWHQLLETTGLFAFYLCTVVSVVALAVWVFASRRTLGLMALTPIAAAAGALIVFGTIALVTKPTAQLSALVSASYAGAVFAIVTGFAIRSGDLWIRVGLLVLSLPLLAYTAGPLLVAMQGEQAMFDGLPHRAARTAHWVLIISACASPYFFSPRPVMYTLMRRFPLIIAAAVGTVGALIIQFNPGEAIRLAAYGLGIDFVDIAPRTLGLSLIALSTITWTTIACLTAPSQGRRDIGIGIALIIVSGTGFAWPFQFMVGVVGLLVIANAGQRVSSEERSPGAIPMFLPPAIQPSVWQSYVASLCEHLADEHGESPQAITGTGENGLTTTRVNGVRGSVDYCIEISMREQSIVRIEIRCNAPDLGDDPTWVLRAIPQRAFGTHPEIPRIRGQVRKTGDMPFDRRFRIVDATRGSQTDILLDDGLRTRLTAAVDGWVAVWPAGGLVMRMSPGQGAPVDHPIPITELAFRGDSAPLAVDRLGIVLHVLTDLAARGANASPPAKPVT